MYRELIALPIIEYKTNLIQANISGADVKLDFGGEEGLSVRSSDGLEFAIYDHLEFLVDRRASSSYPAFAFECYERNARFIQRFTLTRNVLDDLLSDTSGGCVFQFKENLAKVLIVGSALDNQSVALIVISVRLDALEVVPVPFRGTLGDPVDVIVSTQEDVDTLFRGDIPVCLAGGREGSESSGQFDVLYDVQQLVSAASNSQGQ